MADEHRGLLAEQSDLTDISDLEGEDQASRSFDDFGPVDTLRVRKYWYRTAAGVAFAVLVGIACTMYAFPSGPDDTKGPSSAYESRFENQKLYNEYLCAEFEGMYTPAGDACCPAQCGKFCGTANCQDGPGGNTQCCGSMMKQTCTKDASATVNVINAPCKLDMAKPFSSIDQQCGKYGGIDHPLGTKCCDAKCGALCGAKNCWRAGPGYVGCCSSHLDKYCGSNTEKAPCMLGPEPLADQCKDFGGILHPMKAKCCGKLCGAQCGTSDCWRAHGGVSSCCRTMMQANGKELPRCSKTSGSPCNLVPAVSNVFEGILSVSTTDPQAYKDSPQCSTATQEALASAVGVVPGQVAFTNIEYTGGWLVHFSYQITVPTSSELTIQAVTEQQEAMTKEVNANLQNAGAPQRVTLVSLPPPELRYTSMTTSTTVTTTSTSTILTCFGFTCEKGLVLRSFAISIPCIGACTKLVCCVPAPPDTTTAAPCKTEAPPTTSTPVPGAITEQVHTSVSVTGVDYAQLSANPAVMSSFKTGMQDAFAEQSGAGISSADVSISLAAGSVVVKAVITPPPGVVVKSIQDTVAANIASNSLTTKIAASANAVPGISAAKTGDIGAGNPEAPTVKAAPMTAAPTTAAPTTAAPMTAAPTTAAPGASTAAPTTAAACVCPTAAATTAAPGASTAAATTAAPGASTAAPTTAAPTTAAATTAAATTAATTTAAATTAKP